MVIEGTALAALGYVAGKIRERLEDAFGDKVIGRWRNHRAQRFLDAFTEAVAREAQECGDNEQEVNSLLDDLLTSETKTEVLFEAYRHVVLSASKELGPRIIALLAAQLIHEKRPATDDEEMIYRAAESFRDVELKSFREDLTALVASRGPYQMRFPYQRVLQRADLSVSKRRSARTPLGSMNLIDVLGSWAPKAIQVGLIREETLEESSYRPRGNEMDYFREIRWSIIYEPVSERLAKLIERAEAGTNSPA